MEQRNIKIGTHGEQYGNWMSNPVFYMLGGVIAVAALLTFLFFKVFHFPILGVIFLIILIAVVLKYMIGRSELKPGYGFIFIMPMIIEFLATIISWSNSSFIFEIVKTASGYTMHYLPLVIGEVLYILAILFLGLFYMEDADKAVKAGIED